ncbi:glycosyl hydrolase 2 galactose-binding domain-containing protein [Antricoccus suffuscus]|nr:glycoside hydrolase family 2 protein [Antricoccus suffuscus]
MVTWIPIEVPGTAAAALRAAGRPFRDRDYDDEDWWFRAQLSRPHGPGPWVLEFGGLATIADVWLNDEHLLHSENMFQTHRLDIEELADGNELLIRCAALHPLLSKRKPRPRWKVARLQHRGLRWIRTTLLGRLEGWPHTPPPVGPWRDLRLSERAKIDLVERDLHARCHPDGPGGSVTVDLTLRGVLADGPAHLVVGDHSVQLDLHLLDSDDGRLWQVSGEIALPEVEHWWPHTHGEQPLYSVALEIDGSRIDLGRVGFRTIEADRHDDGLTLIVNGTPIFARGACWTPMDPISFTATHGDQRRGLLQLRDANLNVVRVSGETIYEDDAFLDLCDELGLLLWQDCMLAFYDPPDDPDWAGSFTTEIDQQLTRLQGRPCVTVISGGSEIEQQATYAGRGGIDTITALDALIPEALHKRLPQVPYLPSSPTGGDIPTRPDTGVAHYYGVGAYLRELDDARRSGVRFAAECLAFATPSEPRTIDEVYGGPSSAGHHPEWKRSVYRDAGASWDFEDVRNHYTRLLFGVDPDQIRYYDADRALELGRATVAELFTATMSEWRRTSSPMAGAIIFHLRDLVAGAGLGIVDALGQPKAPWHVLRRLMAPVAVALTDEGLNGLAAHLVNDTGQTFNGVLRAELFTNGELCVDSAEIPINIGRRDGLTVTIDSMFTGFRDLTWAHKFGPIAYDVIGVTLLNADSDPVSSAVHLPGGPARDREPDLGLTSSLAQSGSEDWHVEVESRRFAQWVSLDVPGWNPDDSWFHLLPGQRRDIALHPTEAAPSKPTGYIRALNSAATKRFTA